jgi:hypothetical protein
VVVKGKPIAESYIHPSGAGFVAPQFLTDWPLYHTIGTRFFLPEGAPENAQPMLLNPRALAEALETEPLKFDALCPKCQKESHFVGVSGEADKIARHRASMIRPTGPPPPHLGIYARMFFCYRPDCGGFIYVVTVLSARGLTKVGQSPSATDLTLDDSRRYEKQLGEKTDEMIKASIAATFGFSIGAFVYARRVFEFLIDRAEAEATKAGKAPQYAKDTPYPPMWECIEKLADFLPALLVKNAHLYNVLSEGVHALSEEKCALYFPVVREGIELMLQQVEERDAREAAEQRFSAKIGKIHGEIAKGEPRE